VQLLKYFVFLDLLLGQLLQRVFGNGLGRHLEVLELGFEHALVAVEHFTLLAEGQGALADFGLLVVP